MTVTYGVPEWLDGERCRLSWSSDVTGATFRVFRDGDLVSTTQATSLLFVVEPGEALCVEVLDDNSSPQYAAPGAVTLCWWPASGAVEYRVEEFRDGSWVTKATIQGAGRGFFSYLTRWLGDGYAGDWRVVPVGAGGLEASALGFEVRVVAVPSPPLVAWGALGGGVVEVAAG